MRKEETTKIAEEAFRFHFLLLQHIIICTVPYIIILLLALIISGINEAQSFGYIIYGFTKIQIEHCGIGSFDKNRFSVLDLPVKEGDAFDDEGPDPFCEVSIALELGRLVDVQTLETDAVTVN